MIPTLVNLEDKGFEFPSIVATFLTWIWKPFVHSLFCQVAAELWCFLDRWCDLSIPTFVGVEGVVNWINNVRFSSVKRAALESIIVTIW